MLFYNPLRAFSHVKPPMEMISASTGLSVHKYRPRGALNAHYEIRLHLHDPLFDAWETVTVEGTYPTREAAIEAAKAHLTSDDELVWPATASGQNKVDKSPRKR